MINSYFTDTTRIIEIQYDEQNRETTTETTVKCRLDFGTRNIVGPEGQQLASTLRAFLPTGTSIKIGDKLQPLTLRGSSITMPAFNILNIGYLGGFGNTHIEVLC